MYFTLAKFSMITPATATCNCTCLGYLGWHDTKRNGPICVALSKVAKGTKEGDIMLQHHWAATELHCMFSVITPATATCNCNCHGYFGRHDTNRNDLICVALPKVAKGTKEGDIMFQHHCAATELHCMYFTLAKFSMISPSNSNMPLYLPWLPWSTWLRSLVWQPRKQIQIIRFSFKLVVRSLQ